MYIVYHLGLPDTHLESFFDHQRLNYGLILCLWLNTYHTVIDLHPSQVFPSLLQILPQYQRLGSSQVVCCQVSVVLLEEIFSGSDDYCWKRSSPGSDDYCYIIGA